MKIFTYSGFVKIRDAIKLIVSDYKLLLLLLVMNAVRVLSYTTVLLWTSLVCTGEAASSFMSLISTSILDMTKIIDRSELKEIVQPFCTGPLQDWFGVACLLLLIMTFAAFVEFVTHMVIAKAVMRASGYAGLSLQKNLIRNFVTICIITVVNALIMLEFSNYLIVGGIISFIWGVTYTWLPTVLAYETLSFFDSLKRAFYFWLDAAFQIMRMGLNFLLIMTPFIAVYLLGRNPWFIEQYCSSGYELLLASFSREFLLMARVWIFAGMQFLCFSIFVVAMNMLYIQYRQDEMR